MPDQPLYQGARLDIASSIPHPLATPDITSKATAQASANAAAGIDSIINDFIKIKDFGTSQQQENKLRNINSGFEAEANRRMSLAPGHEQSLFDDNGNINANAADDLIHEYTTQINELPGSYINPASAMQAANIRQSVAGNLRSNLYNLAAKKQIQTSRTAFEDNLSLAISQKDYTSAINNLEQAVANGLISRTRANQHTASIRHDAAMEEANNLAVTNPVLLYDRLENQEYDGTLSPVEQHFMRGKLQAERDNNLRDGFLKSFLLEPKEGGSSSTKKDGNPAFTGLFTEQECGWMTAINSGKFPDVEKSISAKAIEEARAFKPDSPDSPGMENARDNFINRYSMLGMEKEWLARQWRAAEEANKKLQTPTIDASKLMDNIADRGLLHNEKDFAYVRSLTEGEENKKRWDKKGDLRARYMVQAGINDATSRTNVADTSDVAISKYLKLEESRQRDELRAKVLGEFTSWRDSTEEGQKATAFMQAEKLHSLVREATGRKDLQFTNSGASIDRNIESARKTQENKYLQFVNANKRNIYVDTAAAQEQPIQQVNLGYDKNRKDLPAGILLPKSMMEGVNKENGVVEVTFDNKRFRRFRVVGECDGDSPVMTYETARERFYNPDNSYKVKMRIRKGNTEQLMQEQDRAVNTANEPGRLMIENEARRDENGNLTVYKLPAGDGGGTHEIAGINNKNHPQEFARLKGMIESGRHDEAEQEASRYMMAYTQPASDVLEKSGVQSRGLDYFIRDMYLNGGESFPSRVIHRALGIADSKKFTAGTAESISEFLKTHSEEELLGLLHQSRDELYKSIAANNPEKGKFLTGWLNRSRKSYRQAQDMA